MLQRITIIFVCVIQSVKNNANFPQLVTTVGFSVYFCGGVSIVKEAKNVKRSVAFQCVTVEGSEILISSRPAVSSSGSNVMMKLNCDIQIHCEVTQRTECTLYLSYDTSVWLQPAPAAMEGFGIHVQNKEFSLKSLLNSHTFTFLPLWSTESNHWRV
jgi:hypothetical protein